MAAISVLPERETPGMMANAWAQPISSASRSVISSNSRTWRARRSTTASSRATTTSAVAITHSERSEPSMACRKATPAMPAGMVPTIK